MTWVDTDGEHVLINVPADVQKHRNVLRDPRVSFAVSDPTNQRRYIAGRGRGVGLTEDATHEYINSLAVRYLGTTFAAMGGHAQHRPVILSISVDTTHQMGWDAQ